MDVYSAGYGKSGHTEKGENYSLRDHHVENEWDVK